MGIKNAAAEKKSQQQQEYIEYTINELRIIAGLDPIDKKEFDVKFLFERDVISGWNWVR